MGKEWPIALARGWHPVAYLADVGRAPMAVKLMGHPLVVFRDGDAVGVLEDRCPHRNVPLSSGRCVDGQIECPYHGWRFDTQGQCRLVPGSIDG
ncbi:MAG: Rieske 2Fe-2S domain-containing protein, partial [Sphingopyxis sp.]